MQEQMCWPLLVDAGGVHPESVRRTVHRQKCPRPAKLTDSPLPRLHGRRPQAFLRRLAAWWTYVVGFFSVLVSFLADGQ